MKKILISTGGSGGHVIPAIAFYEHFNEKFKVYLSTDKRGSRFIDKKIYEYELIDVPNIFSSIFYLPLNLIKFFLSFLKSFIYLKKNKIDILLSTGGYMSLPLCFASKILNIKLYLFEPNMVIGRANKLIIKFSKKVICHNNEIKGLSVKYKDKIYVSKSILRKEIYNVKKNLKLKIEEPINILILGGSQGAKFFDTTMQKLIINLSNICKLSVSQQIHDKKNEIEIRKIYEENKIENYLFSFDKSLHNKLNLYDLAITRSGASTISELAYSSIPFIAVPFPFAKDDHQYFNAKYYFDKNCCWLFEQKDFDEKKIINLISELVKDERKYREKKENIIKFSYQNTWNNINQKLLALINEN